MKKLDNNVLRKLILETIEESSILSEGKKKKRMKEVQPVPQADEESPVNPEQDVAHGMESEPQPEDFGMGENAMPHLSEKEVQLYTNALHALNDEDELRAAGALGILEKLADYIKERMKQSNNKNNSKQ